MLHIGAESLLASQPSVEVLKKKLTDSWDQIEIEPVRTACAYVIQRLRRVTNEKGKYTE